MLVRANRTLSGWRLRAAGYGALALAGVLVFAQLVAGLRAQGWEAGMAFAAAGAAALALAFAALSLSALAGARLAAWREAACARLGLPTGPCCVVWREGEVGDDEETMPWDLIRPMRARYPGLARRLGVEGVALVDFEVSAEGRAKNVSCAYAWPSDIFYHAAREALAYARFAPSPDVHPRFGASYRIGFVFRIAGAARLVDKGRRARTLIPALETVRRRAAQFSARR